MDNDLKTIAIAAYLTPVGWVVAYIAKSLNAITEPFVIFHLRQGLGLNIIMLLLWITFKFVDLWLIEQLVIVVMVLSMVYGALSAYHGTQRMQLFVGQWFDRWFSFIR